jgi:hypothetical protein
MHRSAFLLFLPLFLISCETTESTKPSHLSTSRGLQAESSAIGNKALVKQSDPKTLEKYRKVVIEDVKVAQPKSSSNVKRASRDESERLAERFEEILREELSPHYQITNRRGRDTLSVRATLTELQPSRPALFVFNYLPYAAALTTGVSFATGKTPGAGSTTVEAEVLDSLSRRQVYAIVDQYKGSKFQPHGIERWGQTEASMRTWSRKIRAGIQGSAVRTTAPASKTTAKVNRESAPSASEKKAGEGSKIGAFFREHRSE